MLISYSMVGNILGIGRDSATGKPVVRRHLARSA